ncbi:MAG: ribonuclease III [Bacteroidaceae bacterium]|nr:ribonuclease III [Bacteroidaceae bacterium]MBR1788237.1 ribonuclease III [Bacteroidaceae bacterium]
MDFRDLITQIKLPFLKDRELYRSLYNILGFYPCDIRPYKVAMRHRSASRQNLSEDGKRINNERLEFLGDAILGAVVGHIVFKQFPRKPEGFLTNTRSNIVRRQSLNRLAKETGFDKLIIANYKPTTHNDYVKGNAFEALVGAIYLDRGYGHCVRFVKKKIMDQLVNIENVSKEVNYKSKLIEWGQKHKINIDFLGEEGKEDGGASPIFWSSIIIAGAECGRGKGYSKKESQQNAAREALERIHKDRNFVLSITAPKELQMERYDDIPSVTAEEKQAAQHMDDDSVDIDFSDITMKAKSREDIIAKAEAQAFAE